MPREMHSRKRPKIVLILENILDLRPQQSKTTLDEGSEYRTCVSIFSLVWYISVSVKNTEYRDKFTVSHIYITHEQTI